MSKIKSRHTIEVTISIEPLDPYDEIDCDAGGCNQPAEYRLNLTMSNGHQYIMDVCDRFTALDEWGAALVAWAEEEEREPTFVDQLVKRG
jgi:hypothetical protein